jgi:hypothetical protein
MLLDSVGCALGGYRERVPGLRVRPRTTPSPMSWPARWPAAPSTDVTRELEEKFRDQAASVITDADALIKAIWALDEAGSSDALFAWTASGDK